MNYFCEKCRCTEFPETDKHIGYVRIDEISYTLCSDCWPIFSNKLDSAYKQLAKEFIEPVLTGNKGQA